MRKSKFERCMLLIKTLRNSSGLNFSKIYTKTNIQSKSLGSYLDFLEKEDFIGSRPPRRSDNCLVSTEQIYFAKERGYRFESGWEKYVTKFDLDNLKKQL